MAKMNRALFTLLRSKVEAKFNTERPNCGVFIQEERKAVDAAISKASKEKLKEALLLDGNRDWYPGRDPEFWGVKSYRDLRAEWVDPNKAWRDVLLTEIDNAEMLYLAGDNAAALALIEKINSL